MTKRILFIGAHADDEIASAGFLSKYLKIGHEVFVSTFSFGHTSDISEPEFDASLGILGIRKENTFKYRYPIRHFPEYRQAILEDLIELRKRVNPYLALIPNTMDTHQDHHVVSDESRRAFNKCGVLGYESPKHLLLTDRICYVKLSVKDFQKKMDSMNCYKSQSFRWSSNYLDYREPLTKLRGIQAGCKYAEAYEVIRLVF